MSKGSFLRGLGVEQGDELGPTGSALSAFIDRGSEFEGRLSFKDTVRIDGRFQGEISSENTLVVGESGEIQASVRSQNVIVSGSIIGDVQASCSVVLHKTGRIEGDVETRSLVMEEGATLNGRVTMKGAPSEKASSLEVVSGGRDPAEARPGKVEQSS
jgi:cytoskeletal protein CcmA (bactofilin family)